MAAWDTGWKRSSGFWKAPGGFGEALAACSALGPVAYVEAEYFGGHGSQAAQVWDGGEAVLGPDVDPSAGTPISQALRRLGVARGPDGDEFDAVGLGRHRDPEDWLGED
ncbi:hypothetical protein ACFQV2_07705 [Actinokineospora soli]|uniref:Uncharacterized protein n=1 Tax=Actinokineospora soli TaxID=1048753 RepID=A0ABW2TKZ5_9PSEU